MQPAVPSPGLGTGPLLVPIDSPAVRQSDATAKAELPVVQIPKGESRVASNTELRTDSEGRASLTKLQEEFQVEHRELTKNVTYLKGQLQQLTEKKGKGTPEENAKVEKDIARVTRSIGTQQRRIDFLAKEIQPAAKELPVSIVAGPPPAPSASPVEDKEPIAKASSPPPKATVKEAAPKQQINAAQQQAQEKANHAGNMIAQTWGLAKNGDVLRRGGREGEAEGEVQNLKTTITGLEQQLKNPQLKLKDRQKLQLDLVKNQNKLAYQERLLTPSAVVYNTKGKYLELVDSSAKNAPSPTSREGRLAVYKALVDLEAALNSGVNDIQLNSGESKTIADMLQMISKSEYGRQVLSHSSKLRTQMADLAYKATCEVPIQASRNLSEALNRPENRAATDKLLQNLINKQKPIIENSEQKRKMDKILAGVEDPQKQLEIVNAQFTVADAKKFFALIKADVGAVDDSLLREMMLNQIRNPEKLTFFYNGAPLDPQDLLTKFRTFVPEQLAILNNLANTTQQRLDLVELRGPNPNQNALGDAIGRVSRAGAESTTNVLEQLMKRTAAVQNLDAEQMKSDLAQAFPGISEGATEVRGSVNWTKAFEIARTVSQQI